MERAVVIGISAGGDVAQMLLQSHPERVEHAVLSHCGVLEQTSKGETKARRAVQLVRLLPPSSSDGS
jgi:pimeloyl-ACP methyl ester carboxylesterase